MKKRLHWTQTEEGKKRLAEIKANRMGTKEIDAEFEPAISDANTMIKVRFRITWWDHSMQQKIELTPTIEVSKISLGDILLIEQMLNANMNRRYHLEEVQ